MSMTIRATRESATSPTRSSRMRVVLVSLTALCLGVAAATLSGPASARPAAPYAAQVTHHCAGRWQGDTQTLYDVTSPANYQLNWNPPDLTKTCPGKVVTYSEFMSLYQADGTLLGTESMTYITDPIRVAHPRVDTHFAVGGTSIVCANGLRCLFVAQGAEVVGRPATSETLPVYAVQTWDIVLDGAAPLPCLVRLSLQLAIGDTKAAIAVEQRAVKAIDAYDVYDAHTGATSGDLRVVKRTVISRLRASVSDLDAALGHIAPHGSTPNATTAPIVKALDTAIGDDAEAITEMDATRRAHQSFVREKTLIEQTLAPKRHAISLMNAQLKQSCGP